MKRINRAFPQLVLLSLALPALLGLALTGTVRGALTGLLWGGFVRIFVQHHVTWSVNSICHFFGTRRFDVEDESTNVFWLALPSFGESWHHNHHAFPRSAAHGLRWWEIDLSEMVIRLMRRLGLAWDVVLIPPARQKQKLAAQPVRSRLGEVSGRRSADAGGEQAEVVGQRAVGEVGDARAQDGDRLGRRRALEAAERGAHALEPEEAAVAPRLGQPVGVEQHARAGLASRQRALDVLGIRARARAACPGAGAASSRPSSHPERRGMAGVGPAQELLVAGGR